MNAATHSPKQPQRGRGRGRSRENAVLFTIDMQLFAVAAASVQEIRSADSLAGSAIDFEQRAVPKVKHIVEHRDRTCFVVNGSAHFGLRRTRPSLILFLCDSRAAVLVDQIQGMAEIPSPAPLPKAFMGEERAWYRGLTYHDDRVIPVVNPSGFLNREELETLEAAAKNISAAQLAAQESAS
jgi:chemotaxis signal transduction protein